MVVRVRATGDHAPQETPARKLRAPLETYAHPQHEGGDTRFAGRGERVVTERLANGPRGAHLARAVATVAVAVVVAGGDRVYPPIELDIAAETPAEIALAVIAEITLVRRGGTGRPLSPIGQLQSQLGSNP